MNSRVLSQIVIPARLDSTRLHGKALLPVAGKTILQHVWERACRANVGPTPILATDDERIAAVARGFGAPVVLTATSHRCGSERVAEVAASLTAPVVINLQGDEILIEPAALAALPALFTDSNVQMATLVAPLGDQSRLEDPSLVKAVLDDCGNVMYFSRSPIPDPARTKANRTQHTWYGHIGVYAFRREVLIDIYRRPPSTLERAEGLEQLRALQAGIDIRALMCERAHFGINTVEDLEQIRRMLEPEGQCHNH
jgi:3-deoxy-D-manno-octulosonate cytidylyltransferase